MKTDDDQRTPQEIARRSAETLKRMINMPPRPHKDGITPAPGAPKPGRPKTR